MADRHREPRGAMDDPNTPIEPAPQPDPMLVPGRASAVQETLVAMAIVVIVTMVFYGLNHGGPDTSAGTQTTVSAPPTGSPAQTTGQAPQTNQPAGQAPQPSQQEETKAARPETPSPSGQGTR